MNKKMIIKKAIRAFIEILENQNQDIEESELIVSNILGCYYHLSQLKQIYAIEDLLQMEVS